MEKVLVPALDRGLDIIELMASTNEPLSLTEIARAVERTVSEVQRTVAQLALRAYLVRDERGLPSDELLAFVRRKKPSRAERARLAATTASVAARGYEYAVSARVHGVQDVGVPIVLPGGAVIAALTYAFLPLKSAKPAPQPLVAALRFAARVIAESYEPSAELASVSKAEPKRR